MTWEKPLVCLTVPKFFVKSKPSKHKFWGKLQTTVLQTVRGGLSTTLRTRSQKGTRRITKIAAPAEVFTNQALTTTLF